MNEQEAFEHERELFHRACLMDSGARTRFLAQVGDEDPRLRERLEALLEAEENPTLDPPAESVHGLRAAPDQTISGYRLIKRVGDGGMGEVWEAEQEEPIKRRVALKLIRWGMDTENVVRRFESERQALALMEHPNIARVFDAGSTDQGRPFFAMEFVDGVPITEFCDSHRLSVSQRLALFSEVCRGVQHAHQKGVIHRDLKPANILVTEGEDMPVPKIIDFGIAKATEHRLTEQSVFTEHGQWIGTPEYMSPEQTDLANPDVDTRSDVYSLGVVLYELLAGAQPLDAEALRARGYDEMRRAIREEDPPRPSTRVRSTAADEVTVATDRQTSEVELARTLEGDLDWVTMRALEKDRDRRYASPLDLATDIERYLRHEPVIAGPPGGFYRARKFVQRHRVGVVAVTFCAAAMLIGTGLATVGFLNAKASEREAIAQALSARRTADFLEEIFAVMDSGAQMGQVVPAEAVLERGAENIREALHDQPEVQGRLMATLGRVAYNLGHLETADPLLTDALSIQRSALGDHHPAVASTLMTVGYLAFWQGNHKRSLQAFSEAVTILEDSVEPIDRRLLSARASLGLLLTSAGEFQPARQIIDRQLEILVTTYGPDDPTVSDVLLYSGHLNFELGNFKEAERDFERAAEIREALFGTEHYQWAFAATGVARSHRVAGRLEASEELFAKTIEIFERTFGPNHPSLAQALGAQATTLRVKKDWEGAVRHYQRAVEILTGRFGRDHSDLVWVQRGLASTYLRMDRLSEALETANEAHRISMLIHGDRHLETARSFAQTGYMHYALGRYEEARRLYETSHSIREQIFGEDSRYLRITWYGLGCLSTLLGNPEQGLQELQKAVELGFDDPIIFDDPDLETLRGQPEFEALVRTVRSRQQPS